MSAPFTHTTRRQILFGECDPAGIVFYPRYSEMVDANSSALISAALGLTQAQIEKTYGIVGCPMVSCNATYNTPSTYDDVVDITSQVTRIGTSSLNIKTTIAHADGRLIAKFEDTRVWAARANGVIKSCPVPLEVRERLV